MQYLTKGKDNKKTRMLLHVCCVNCLMHPFGILKDLYEITLFFYNPNIYPQTEYKKRLSEVYRVSRIIRTPVIEGKYDHENWVNNTCNFKDEPEGGKRCDRCFSIRLHETAMKAKKGGFDIFSTTLSVSPHKDYIKIEREAKFVSEVNGIDFYAYDFKKNEGFKKTMELAKKLNTYRQNYCGCMYSLKPGNTSKKILEKNNKIKT